MTIKRYTFSESEYIVVLEEGANRGMQMALKRLVKDGLLDKEKADEFFDTHAIVVKPKSFWRKVWNKLFDESKDLETYQYGMVVTEAWEEDDKEKEDEKND